MLERLRVRLRERGIRHDVVDALIPKPPGDVNLDWLMQELDDLISGTERPGSKLAYRPSDQIVRLEKGAVELASALETGSGADALYIYRRVANILADIKIPAGSKDKFEVGASEAVMSLARWVEQIETQIQGALSSLDIASAVASLGSGRGTVDMFFEDTVVLDPDANKRAARILINTVIHSESRK